MIDYRNKMMGDIIRNTDQGYAGEHFSGTDKKAIVLSGGGIDSFMSTVAWLSTRKGMEDFGNVLEGRGDDVNPLKGIELIFLVVNYGQQSYKTELDMTMKQAELFEKYGVSVEVQSIEDPLMKLIRNPLAERKSQKAGNKNYAQNDDYVPNRNARFVFNAAGLAETRGAEVIILGAVGNVNQDNSWAFMIAAAETIKQSNRDHFPVLYAPFVMMSKSMVAMYAEEQEVNSDLWKHTTSCFDAVEISKLDDDTYVEQCGVCRSCVSLKQAFKFADVTDPYFYKDTV